MKLKYKAFDSINSLQWVCVINFFSQRIDELHSLGGLCNYKTLIRLWNYTAYGERRGILWCALVMTAAKKEERELPAFYFIWISWKKSKLWKWVFLYFTSLDTPAVCLNRLWQQPGECGIDPGCFKLFWHAEASRVTALWFAENVCRFAKGCLL